MGARGNCGGSPSLGHGSPELEPAEGAPSSLDTALRPLRRCRGSGGVILGGGSGRLSWGKPPGTPPGSQAPPHQPCAY